VPTVSCGALLDLKALLRWRDKAAYAVGRPSWRSSFLGDPGAKFLCGKRERGTKKEKSSTKERKEGLWKLTLLMEIRKERGFPQQLEKSLAKKRSAFSQFPQAQQQGSIYNVLQTAIHLKKAQFWSEGWGAPHYARPDVKRSRGSVVRLWWLRPRTLA